MNITAQVKVVEDHKLVTVPITSKDKPAVGPEFEEKWQELVDIAARLIGVPAGLIMRLTRDQIEVFTSSRTDDNPYEPGEKAELGYGLYCETVVGTGRNLLVPNALQDENWMDNPDVKLNMISYYGVPVRWPDGDIFGTFCVLDDKENRYTEDQRALVSKFAELVERDLEILHRQEETLRKLSYRETQLRELRHRMKNQLSMLISYINLERSDGNWNFSAFSEVLVNRIMVIYRIHEALTQADIDLTISLPEQVKYIAEEILFENPHSVNLEVRGPEIYLEEKLVFPICMIMNELITNSLKYAFDRVEDPRITIEFLKSAEVIRISYEDNGKASKPNTEVKEGLGSLIIDGLASQLSAETSRNFEEGYHFTLTVPVAT